MIVHFDEVPSKGYFYALLFLSSTTDFVSLFLFSYSVNLGTVEPESVGRMEVYRCSRAIPYTHYFEATTDTWLTSSFIHSLVFPLYRCE
jgi:hypothetical protein